MINLEKSEAAFAEAKKYMPGGVNSPVRSYPNMGCPPPFIREAHGSHIIDIDGNDYIDYVGSWGPMVLGHTHPAVIREKYRRLQKEVPAMVRPPFLKQKLQN